MPAPSASPAQISLVLASASAGRLGTLHRAGIEPVVIVSGVDEDTDETDPATVAELLAVRKARSVAEQAPPDAYVLGCDSVLELDREIHGKPAHAAEAVGRWRRMRGRDGILHTGHCLVHRASGREIVRLASTTVHFADVTDEEIDAYVGTGEPLKVAGAFTLDGLGGAFVSRVEGDPHNVVGLSLPVLRLMFAELGVRWTSLWSSAAVLPPSSDEALQPGP